MSFFKRVFSFGKDEEYDEAIRLFNKHQYKEAIEKFEEILKRKTSTTSLHHNLSRVYLSQAHRNLGIISFAMGNFSIALHEFQKALQFNPDYTELYHFIGVAQNNLGDFEGAIKSFTALLDIEPSNLPTRLKLGVAFHNLGMWDKVISLYRKILKHNPEYADIHYRLGLAYLGRGSMNDAIDSFENALAINPNYLQARIKASLSYAYLGKYDEALTELTAVEEKFPTYADIQYYLGILYTGCDEPEQAIAHFKRALEINPTYKNAKAKLGFLYCHLGRVSEGIKELEGARKIDPQDHDLKMTINALKSTKGPEREREGEFSGILNTVLGGERQIAQTMHEFIKHIEIGPDVSEIVSIIMSVSEEDSSLCEALIPLVQEHIDKHSNYPDLHDSLGTLYLRLGDLKEASLSFGRAVELNKNYLGARFNLFYTLKTLGKNEEALEQGQFISAKNLPYPDFYCALGEVYLALSKFDEALASVERTLALNRSYARAHMLMAQIYEKQGNHELALEELDKCVVCKPPREIQTEIKQMTARLKDSH
ncbi:MAG TPA: tetratricopeptide repeat protein [Syntrophorhabdaceae bacterium]|jgi:tetratricopeptide (TPR) repeat protein